MHCHPKPLQAAHGAGGVEQPEALRFQVGRAAVYHGHFGVLEYAGDKRKLYAFAWWKPTAACCTWSR